MPTLLEKLGKFAYLDKTVLCPSGFEDIQSDRKLRVPRFNDYQLCAQILSSDLFLLGQKLEQNGSRVAMQIEKQKAAARGDVLGCQVTKQRAFPGSGPPQDGHVFRPFDLRNDHAAGGRASIYDLKSDR